MAITKNVLPGGDYFTGAIRATSVTLAAGTVTALPATPLTNRREIWVQNSSGANVWVGDVNIHAAHDGGWLLANTDVQKFRLDASVVLYGVKAAAGSVLVLEFA